MKAIVRPSARAIVLAAGIVCAAGFAVYPSYVQLDMTDPVTRRTFRAVSEEDYRLAIEGRAPFPYQWRILGPWLVRAGERATGADPHAVDVLVKVFALSLSTTALALFARDTVGPALAIGATGFYLAATAGAYASQGYSIYYTSDYLMVAGWFWAVHLLARGKFAAAALVTFAAAWAKETLVLVPILGGLVWWRSRRHGWWLLALVAAFAVPAIALRIAYPAPIGDWAWWYMVRKNVPLVDLDPVAISLALRNNAKVLLFYNVGWLLAARAVWRRRTDRFVADLALTSALYLALAYIVVYIRELRHFLPLAILILPLAIEELAATTTGGPDRTRP